MQRNEFDTITFLETPFCFQNISATRTVQNWYCIQNLRMDLSFQEKNMVWNFASWLSDFAVFLSVRQDILLLSATLFA